MPITDKPQDDRIRESITILRDIEHLGIPRNSPELVSLREKIDAYVREGECWEGTVNFLRFGRMAEVCLPKRADVPIQIRLRVPRTKHT